jgi:membrane-associated phospholipid phosphatase
LLWQGVALAGAAVDEERRSQWLRAWAVIAGSFGVSQIVKLLFRRPRPDLPELPRLMGTMSNRSYPSAHATTSAAAMRVLPPLLPFACGPVVTTTAVAMSATRLYLGLHWPSDVIAGFALGAAVGELAS